MRFCVKTGSFTNASEVLSPSNNHQIILTEIKENQRNVVFSQRNLVGKPSCRRAKLDLPVTFYYQKLLVRELVT